MTPLMLVEATNVPLRGGGVTSSGQLSNWMPPMAAAIKERWNNVSTLLFD